MTGKDALLTALRSTKFLFEMYLGDLSDADLLMRPVPGANHMAWQIGHLTLAEPHLLKPYLTDAAYPDFPPGFAESHTKDAAGKDGPDGFLKKDEYLRLFDRVRSATIEAVSKLSDADFDRPTSGPMASFAPTVGALVILQSNHTLMHGGQFTVVRRKLGKPVLF